MSDFRAGIYMLREEQPGLAPEWSLVLARELREPMRIQLEDPETNKVREWNGAPGDIVVQVTESPTAWNELVMLSREDFDELYMPRYRTPAELLGKAP